MDTRVIREQQPGACVQGQSRGQPMLGWRQRAGPGELCNWVRTAPSLG